MRGMASDAHTALHYGRSSAASGASRPLWPRRWPSPRRYTAFEQLRADPPAYDVYVAGSDQIWNPYIFQDKQFDPPSCWASSGRAAASPTPPAWACLSCRRTRPRSCAVF
ncbi:MAG: hypothetical protein ACLRIS_02350 [Flavonifractor plautii]